jgi:hypothetical protein
MGRTLHTGLLATVCGFLLLPGAANAQGKCAEGRTASGECVNESLAATMRQSAGIFAQPKLSYTAYPILPADDWFYRYPNQLIPDPPLPAPTGTGFGRR